MLTKTLVFLTSQSNPIEGKECVCFSVTLSAQHITLIHIGLMNEHMQNRAALPSPNAPFCLTSDSM